MTQSPCLIPATPATLNIAFSAIPRHHKCGTRSQPIHPQSRPQDRRRTGRTDRVYIPLSSCPDFVRLDKTPNCSLKSLRFFLSNRTKRLIRRTKCLSGRIGQNRPKKGFCRGGRTPHLSPNRPPPRNHIKISLYLTLNPTSVSDVALRTKKPDTIAGLDRNI